MSKFKAAVIGCGGRGKGHARGYVESDLVELVAAADLFEDNAKALAEECAVPKTYKDYKEMLAAEKPEVVSICLWTGLHFEAIQACIDAPTPPKLINAEKPMAPTFGEAKKMHEACKEAGIEMTFSHQRRFGPTFAKAKALLKEGAIGNVERLEGSCPNLFDWGTHWFDMILFFKDQAPVEWVMGQIDLARENKVFGAAMETNGLSLFHFADGSDGMLITGDDRRGGRTGLMVFGTEGMLFVDGQKLRVLRSGHAWEEVACAPDPDGLNDTQRYVVDSVECLKKGTQSILCSKFALQATELIFATYESSRRRARVKLPLTIDDSPLLSMLESGDLVMPPPAPKKK